MEKQLVLLAAIALAEPFIEAATSTPALTAPVTEPPPIEKPEPTRIQVPTPEPSRIETPELPRVKIGKDGKRMILIPAGEFLRGTSEADILEMALRFNWKSESFDDEKPQRKIYLDAYYIDETPVTNAEYKRFLDANPFHRLPSGWDEAWRSFPSGKDDYPVVNVAWDDANAYARWAGKRLPTEAEWEKAARGTDGRRYPWGNEFDSSRCNSYESKVGDTTPVGKYSPRGDSPYGVKDMAGNVWEWCADWYEKDYFRKSPDKNPKGPDSGNYRSFRGGAFLYGSQYVRCACRDRYDPNYQGGSLGFRVGVAPV